MPLKPPFHKQETRYSCVPACLRMVLGSFDVDISKSVLRTRCACTPYGTNALMAVDAARALGFVSTVFIKRHNTLYRCAWTLPRAALTAWLARLSIYTTAQDRLQSLKVSPAMTSEIAA